MPKFRVLRRVDAYVDYVAEVEADSAAQAVSLAYDDERKYAWRPQGTSQYDYRVFVALDENGRELPETERTR